MAITLTEDQKRTLEMIEGMRAALVMNPTGSGKTYIGLGWQPEMVSAPAHLIPQWERACEAYGSVGVKVVSHGKLQERIKRGETFEVDGLVIDEAHTFRGENIMPSRLALQVRAQRILMLTATPASMESDEMEGLGQLAKALTGASRMAIVKEIPVDPGLPPVEMMLWFRQEGFKSYPRMIHWRLMGSPYPADEHWVRMCLEEYEQKIKSKAKVIIAALGHVVLDEMAKAFGVESIDGRMKPSLRADVIEKWKSSDQQVAVMSWLACGTGLNIENADAVIFPEVPRTPLELMQMIGRLRRRGRVRPVHVILIMSHGITWIEKFKKLMKRMRGLQEMINDVSVYKEMSL